MRGGGLAIGASLALHLLVAAVLVRQAPVGRVDPPVLEISLAREAPAVRRERPPRPARAPAASPPSPAASSVRPTGPQMEPSVDGPAPAPAAPPGPSPPSAPAPAAMAPAASPEGVAAAYARRVWARINAHRPRTAPGAGTAEVAFRLDAGGRLTALRLVSSSGRPAFDRAALASVRAAAPFPAPPEGLDPAALDFEIPIRSGG